MSKEDFLILLRAGLADGRLTVRRCVHPIADPKGMCIVGLVEYQVRTVMPSGGSWATDVSIYPDLREVSISLCDGWVHVSDAGFRADELDEIATRVDPPRFEEVRLFV